MELLVWVHVHVHTHYKKCLLQTNPYVFLIYNVNLINLIILILIFFLKAKLNEEPANGKAVTAIRNFLIAEVFLQNAGRGGICEALTCAEVEAARVIDDKLVIKVVKDMTKSFLRQEMATHSLTGVTSNTNEPEKEACPQINPTKMEEIFSKLYASEWP